MGPVESCFPTGVDMNLQQRRVPIEHVTDRVLFETRIIVAASRLLLALFQYRFLPIVMRGSEDAAAANVLC